MLTIGLRNTNGRLGFPSGALDSSGRRVRVILIARDDISYPDFKAENPTLLRAVLDGATWAAALITLVSCVSFVSAWDDRASGAPAMIIGILLAVLGTGGAFISRKYKYTNGVRLSASIAVIAVPVILLGMMQLTGIWPERPYETVDTSWENSAAYHYDHYSLPLADLAIAIPTLIAGLIVGLKLRAGVAVGVAFAAFVAIVISLLSLAELSTDSAWVPGCLTLFAAACALLAERKDRSLATWLHPFVIVGVPGTLAAMGLWDEADMHYGLIVAVFAVLAFISGAVSVLLTRTLYAVAAIAALIAAEITLFNDLIHNPALALSVSLLTGLGLVVGIVIAVVKRGSSRPLHPGNEKLDDIPSPR